MSDSLDRETVPPEMTAYTTTLGAPLYRLKSDRHPLLFLPPGINLTILDEDNDDDEVFLVETEVRQRGYVRRSDVSWNRAGGE